MLFSFYNVLAKNSKLSVIIKKVKTYFCTRRMAAVIGFMLIYLKEEDWFMFMEMCQNHGNVTECLDSSCLSDWTMKMYLCVEFF